ncbi:MAG: DUF1501 domain-containing protein, partial [Verrucomicrobiota bacterium]|nr:DUF1501 domain-containing protein [Verrucomicrobiota bacterium]
MDQFILNRRQTLNNLACGFGSLAFGALAHRNSLAAESLSSSKFHHRPKAKRVIFIFMAGGVSHLDSFDYKE